MAARDPRAATLSRSKKNGNDKLIGQMLTRNKGTGHNKFELTQKYSASKSQHCQLNRGKVRFDSYCHFLLLNRGVAMHHLLRLSKGGAGRGHHLFWGLVGPVRV